MQARGDPEAKSPKKNKEDPNMDPEMRSRGQRATKPFRGRTHLPLNQRPYLLFLNFQ